MKYNVPINEKLNITVEEAAAYSGIGIHKIREIIANEDSGMVLKIGKKKEINQTKTIRKVFRTKSLFINFSFKQRLKNLSN